MVLLQITTSAIKHGAGGDVCRFAHGDRILSVTHRSDALRRLLREMVALGYSGAAEVRGEDGTLRLVIRSIERATRFILKEDERRGFSLSRHQPHPNAVARAATAERLPAPAAGAVPASA
ncbi:hypothetical protein M0638_07685 [Roseomonas sp. NAR14]|uniref:Uncharacterized protein n=1 Tax=Roseomonas acroporae TaxID=2937791 RepID=A0A9X2BTF6_9PROT|nr:hypothetical protein [Roseomonas acroporae]MCK8784257.1 hypothetical protein [Roseomonas acroporae]